MSKEQDRLLSMLNEKKITEEDYQLLSAALNKKNSSIYKLLLILTNPFQKIAGFRALVAGLMVIFGMSYLGAIGKFYSVGIIGCLNASVITNSNIQPTFLLILYQNLVVWLVATFVFIIVAKIFQQKRLRLLDFFGTVAFARFPFLIMTGFLAIARALNLSFLNIDLSKGFKLHPSFSTSLFSAVIILCFIWEIATYFYALKESSGLTGKKLWLGFIGAIFAGEMIASPLTTIFF